jgi:hypothetical protein
VQQDAPNEMPKNQWSRATPAGLHVLECVRLGDIPGIGPVMIDGIARWPRPQRVSGDRGACRGRLPLSWASTRQLHEFVAPDFLNVVQCRNDLRC